MTTNTLPTTRPLACPPWCELSTEDHAPTWHADALRVDHERVWRVQDAGTVVVGQEAIYHPEGAGLRLTLGPVVASCEAVDGVVTPDGLRALAAALVEAAELVDALTQADRMDASDVSPTMACNGWHTFTLGRCARCGIVAPGVVGATVD